MFQYPEDCPKCGELLTVTETSTKITKVCNCGHEELEQLTGLPF